MKKSTKLVALGAALILSGILVTTLSLSSQVSAQGSTVDVEKLKQILNESRMAIELARSPSLLTFIHASSSPGPQSTLSL
jgi:hypothetical protein